MNCENKLIKSDINVTNSYIFTYNRQTAIMPQLINDKMKKVKKVQEVENQELSLSSKILDVKTFEQGMINLIRFNNACDLIKAKKLGLTIMLALLMVFSFSCTKPEDIITPPVEVTPPVVTPPVVKIDSIKYLRFLSYYSDDDGQTNVYEIYAYSKNINIALNKTAFASSTQEYGYSDASKAVDGNAATRWSSDREIAKADSINPVWLVINMKKSYSVDSIKLNISGWDSHRQTFNFSVSNDSIKWYSIGDGKNVTGCFTYKHIN